MATEPRAKKKKADGKSKHLYKVGNGFIDLDFFLNGPDKKKAKPGAEEEEEEEGRLKAEGAGTSLAGPAGELDGGDGGPGAAAAVDCAPQPPAARKRRRGGGADGREGPRGRRRGDGDSLTGDPALFAARKALPIFASRHAIRAALAGGDVLVLVGETGSGKSTQVPQYLCDEPWCTGLVGITQPRRVAATTLAHRVAREAGTPLPPASSSTDAAATAAATGRVGYSVRFDHRVPRGAKIKFLTEGMLLQEMVRDPALRAYSAIVVDEVHERSIDADLLLGFLRQILHGRGARRPRLKVVVMSATADVDKICAFFAAPAPAPAPALAPAVSRVQSLRIPGRQFPVEIVHTPAPVQDILEALVQAVFQIHVQEPLPGDVLAFLSGQEEIEAATRLIGERAAALESNVPRVEVCPLYGQLSMEAQNKAFLPASRAFARKVVLATNIAETSVTVPGVRYVVDNGKAKVKMFRARLGLESLLVKPIAQSSAIQRAGRAGREGPGKCVRLYTAAAFARELAPAELPEMLRVDILGAVLTMKACGIDNTFAFPLLDAPDDDLMERALVELRRLGALGDDVRITPAGRTMALLPVSAAYGRVLLDAAAAGCALEAIDVVACLTAGNDLFVRLPSEFEPGRERERDEMEALRKALARREGDLLTYLTTVQRAAATPSSQRKAWCQQRGVHYRNLRQALSIRRQLRSICVRQKLLDAADVAADDDEQGEAAFVPLPPDRAEGLLRCFLRAFVLKTAMLAPDGSYVTTEGKHVVAIHPSSTLHGVKTEAILFLEQIFTTKNYARKVSAIQSNWIVDALREQQM